LRFLRAANGKVSINDYQKVLAIKCIISQKP
jgi:hypothetical protein